MGIILAFQTVFASFPGDRPWRFSPIIQEVSFYLQFLAQLSDIQAFLLKYPWELSTLLLRYEFVPGYLLLQRAVTPKALLSTFFSFLLYGPEPQRLLRY